MGNYFMRVHKQTATKLWINNVTLSEADRAIAAGAVGCTQNPSYVWRILNHSEDREIALRHMRDIVNREADNEEALIQLQSKLVEGIAERFRPMYEASGGQYGYVSIQGSPIHEDKDTILKHARFHASAAPNIMAKIPVTEDGLEAIAILAQEGVPINATECMTVQQVLDVCETYVEATKGMAHPAPLYYSLITGIYDEYLQNYVKENHVDIERDILWQAGMSVARKVYALVQEREYPCGMIGGGARGLHHFTEMVGADASITINWVGTADQLIEQDPPVVSRFFQPTPYSVEDELLRKLPDHRKAYFIDGIKPSEYEDFGPVELFRGNFVGAWNRALAAIEESRSQVLAGKGGACHGA